MSHRPVRTALLAAAAAVGCVLALASTGAAEASEAGRLVAADATLVPHLLAAGGTVSPDGRWVDLPNGVSVALRPTVFTDCPGGYVCLWEDANFAGRMYKLTGSNAANLDLGTVAFDNVTTSWGNRSVYDARWFYNTNLGGTTRCMNSASSLNNVGSTDNDKASSLKIYTDAAACS